MTFIGFTLQNHPQFTSISGVDSVQWFRGTVRIAKESDPNGERKVLKVIRIDNIDAGNLKVYALDESYINDPLQAGDLRIASVNFYPGYRVYLYHNAPCRLTENDTIPQTDDILEKYSIFGLRSESLQYSGYKSRISIPTIMFGKKIEAPQTPQQPLGAKYATRPDYFGRSSYAFTTSYTHKPFSVIFLRTSDDILLNALYNQSPYGEEVISDTVQDIRTQNNDEFFNDRLLDLANATIDTNSSLFKTYNNYHLPLPNNIDFYNGINNFIDEHNQFYQENLPHKQAADMLTLSTVIIPAHPSGKYGKLELYDFVKQTIENTFVPLTEIPIIYQHIRSGSYQPQPKSQVIRDRNGYLLNPASQDFDMAPMMKVLETNPHKTLFVDFTLDGASKSVYFYSVKETNVQMMQSSLSPAVGPVRMVNSFPLRTPEIKSVTQVLANSIFNTPSSMRVEVNSFDKIHQVKKLKLYRALNMEDAMSVRTMKMVQELELSESNIIDDSIWSIDDNFSDLSEIPYGGPLYYRVVAERQIHYAEPNYTGQPDVIVTDFAPSEASKLMITSMTESSVPSAAPLLYIGNENPAQVSNLIFKWSKQVYNGKYHLYKMNAEGKWIRISTLQSNEAEMTLELVTTDWGSDILPLVDMEGNPLFHHFKLMTENTAGVLSTAELILTIGNNLAFSVENNVLLARYAPYFTTADLNKDQNIFTPPYAIYGNFNSPNGVTTNPEILNAWKRMPHNYIILPEILHDHRKNPVVYNINTKKFGCYYSVTRMWDGNVQNSQANFLRESVKRTRMAGARECIVNLGDNEVFIKNNIEKLKFAIASQNDRGMDTITLVINGNYKHYTLDQISNL